MIKKKLHVGIYVLFVSLTFHTQYYVKQKKKKWTLNKVGTKNIISTWYWTRTKKKLWCACVTQKKFSNAIYLLSLNFFPRRWTIFQLQFIERTSDFSRTLPDVDVIQKRIEVGSNFYPQCFIFGQTRGVSNTLF